ncbi:hypothetical protein BXU06_13535 [Aquaspirillum sp. LM1]|uniref:hypothetical protein n=1 Tax=Aquaspirillum sp. LM1 TaxID=1938604 RepID=UPI000983D22E|nr:hypothetical protein [Aquaspirillum sp. LM1]AQR65964.1 hypothetical protein BXU06_13535 [Aquaspirillum sp. LM1]
MTLKFLFSPKVDAFFRTIDSIYEIWQLISALAQLLEQLVSAEVYVQLAQLCHSLISQVL